MLNAFSDGSAPVTTQSAPTEEVQPPTAPIVDIIACDGIDTSSLVACAHGLGAEVRVSQSLEPWFDQLGRQDQGKAPTPADVVVLVGGGERIATQRWVARAVAAAVDSRVVAALVDGTLDHAMNVVGQGARGLLILPNSAERLAFHLREAIEAAMSCQAVRRSAAKHRQAIATLTAGETQVLESMLDGLANKQIAQRLSIGLRTVELRRSKIMRKMNAASLAQLISFVCATRQNVG